MTKLYNIALEEGSILRIGFGTPAQNDDIVKFVAEEIKKIDLPGGSLIKVNGPASLPVAMLLAHEIAHKYGAIACLDPKLSAYVVCISHTPEYKIGDLIS